MGEEQKTTTMKDRISPDPYALLANTSSAIGHSDAGSWQVRRLDGSSGLQHDKSGLLR